MKIKVAIVILAVACIALGIALFATKKQSDDQHAADVSSIVDFSNQLVSAGLNLNELNQVNLALTNDLSLSRDQALQLSNSLSSANATLTNMVSSLSGANDQITNLNNQINDLEAQNKVLDERANELTNTIAQLNSLIEDTQNKLAVSETNNVFLQDQLQKQIAQKAELEHKFNDLNEVRAQVRKLKDEMFVARRIQLDNNDSGTKKGGELLIQRTPPAAKTQPKSSNYDLNVEVGSDGSVKVIPPLVTTNSPGQ